MSLPSTRPPVYALLLLLFVFVASGPEVCGQQPRTLTVESMPYERLAIAASPADLNGESDGLSNFSRQYADGVVVTLQAPAADGAHTFVKWRRNGADFSTNPIASVTMNADHLMTAVYHANNQVLINGSFEDGYTGWTNSGNQQIKPNNPDDPDAATDGSSWVAFNAGQSVPNGVVSQIFDTQPGVSYTLAFDVGTLSYNGSQQKMRYEVIGAAPRLSGTETLTGQLNGNVAWQSKSYNFTADSNTTILKFTDVSTTSNATDLYLDNVRIYTAISTPPATPVAVNEAATVHPGQKVLIDVLANDSGMMDPGTVEIITPPSAGTATVQSSGEILYAHEGGDTSPVSFSYRVSGEGGTSNPATVNIPLASTLRIPSDSINLPAESPATAVQVIPAFPGLVFDEPLAFASPPDDISRLFVCERGGKIKVIPDVTAATATSSLMLDLAQAVENPIRVPLESWDPGRYDESGLMGMTFHPNFAQNGHFYVSYLVKKANDTSTDGRMNSVKPEGSGMFSSAWLVMMPIICTIM